MTPDELKGRTRRFAVEIIALVRELPQTLDGRICGSQLLRAATSAAANYRATCRSRSRAEFAARVGVALEEADESLLWLELMQEAGMLERERIAHLLREANELTAIFVASRKTARGDG